MIQLPPLTWWQQEEVDKYALEPRRGIFWGPRCRKTRAAIASMLAAGYRRGIVVAPLTVCPQWHRLLENGYGLTVVPAYKIARGKLISELLTKGGNYVVVIPWKSIRSKNESERSNGRASRVEVLLRKFVTEKALILDESHVMASPSSHQACAARLLAKDAAWVRLLTGTPVPSHYGGLWGQLVALHPTEFETSYGAFAARYLIRNEYMFNRVEGHTSLVESELRPKMNRYVSIRRRVDLFGPDTFEEEDRELEMPPGARTMYDEFAKNYILTGDLNVSAPQILTRLMRLHQIAQGFITDQTGSDQHIHSEKLIAVVEDIERIVVSGEKVVVFHTYDWERLSLLMRLGRRKDFGVPVYTMHGGTKVADREKLLLAMEEPGSKIAIIQTKTGGTGVSLAEVPYQLVMSETFDYTTQEQRHDRTYNPGIARFITYYRMKGTIDEYIAFVLGTKQTFHQAIMNADREQLVFGMIPRQRLHKRSLT